MDVIYFAALGVSVSETLADQRLRARAAGARRSLLARSRALALGAISAGVIISFAAAVGAQSPDVPDGANFPVGIFFGLLGLCLLLAAVAIGLMYLAYRRRLAHLAAEVDPSAEASPWTSFYSHGEIAVPDPFEHASLSKEGENPPH